MTAFDLSATAPVATVRALGLVLGLAIFGVGCKPEVGDSCQVGTDCSVQGDRFCDTSMTGGYCTIFNCTPNSCPGESVCVEFHATTGEPVLPSGSGSRFARRFCVRTCEKSSDCRDGYACVGAAARDGRVIDSTTDFQLCLP